MSDGCYCAVLGRMAPCSWCFSPDRNEEPEPETTLDQALAAMPILDSEEPPQAFETGMPMDLEHFRLEAEIRQAEDIAALFPEGPD